MIQPARFPRTLRDDPTRSGECTNIPGFYGEPRGVLGRERANGVLRIAIKAAILLYALGLLSLGL